MREQKERAKSSISEVVASNAAAPDSSVEGTAPVGTPENPSHAIFTIANVITFCRLLFTIAFLVLFIDNNPETRTLALIFYTVAAVTDFLDGQVARRTQTVSWVGKVMDPIMDRALLFTGVIGLVATGELPLWVAIFVILRDIILFGGTLWLRVYQSRPMDVTYVGKFATAFLMSGFVDLLIAAPMFPALGIVNVSWLPGLNHVPAAMGMYFVYVGVVLSTIAAVKYYRDGLHVRRMVLDGLMERE